MTAFDGLDRWCEERGVRDDSMIFCLNTGKAVSLCDREYWELGLNPQSCISEMSRRHLNMGLGFGGVAWAAQWAVLCV